DPSVRILPERDDDQGDRTARKQSQSDSETNQRGLHHVRGVAQPVPMWNLYRNHRSCAACCHADGEGEVSDGDQEQQDYRYGTVSKLGAVTVLNDSVVGNSAATLGRVFRVDCRIRRNEPVRGGGHPLQTSAFAVVSPSSH